MIHFPNLRPSLPSSLWDPPASVRDELERLSEEEAEFEEKMAALQKDLPAAVEVPETVHTNPTTAGGPTQVSDDGAFDADDFDDPESFDDPSFQIEDEGTEFDEDDEDGLALAILGDEAAGNEVEFDTDQDLSIGPDAWL